MPHLILQQSKNVKNPESKVFFAAAHKLLTEKLPTKLSSCKSRLLIADDFLVADGNQDLGFVHLEVAVLAGRTDELLSQVSRELHALLLEHLAADNSGLTLKISVEVRNLSQHYYMA